VVLNCTYWYHKHRTQLYVPLVYFHADKQPLQVSCHY